jgi:Zn-dependent peptidase ImmA (M78 family)
MLTPAQQRRYDLYKELRSLAKVAEREGVSRERIRQTLESMPLDSEEYKDYKAIAEAEKGGRPRQYSSLQEQRRINIRNWRAKQKETQQKS